MIRFLLLAIAAIGAYLVLEWLAWRWLGEPEHEPC